MKANNNVTEALQRTIGLMQAELERSVLSSQLLGLSEFSSSSRLAQMFICFAQQILPRHHCARLQAHTMSLMVS